MSDRLEAAVPAAAANPPSNARAARLRKFKREQLIVEYLNRGVSVAEISARVGVGEKRMRAIIREILARRMPGPPEEFVAIQMSRLNEALLVAYSAMTDMNLGAVDRVVRIVRELDRYRGFCVAERRPEAPPRVTVRGLEGPAEGPAAFGGALAPRVELASRDFEDSNFEDSNFEDLDFAPDAFACEAAEPAKAAPEHAVVARSAEPQETEAADSRLKNPAQSLETADSAPGMGSASDACRAPAPDDRPDSEAAPPGLFVSLARDAFSNGTVAARARLQNALIVASRDEGRASWRLPPVGDGRPENLAQHPEKVQSTPGKSACSAKRRPGPSACRFPFPRPETRPRDAQRRDGALG